MDWLPTAGQIVALVMAAECARLGIGEVLAAATLGHRDPRTTRQHYQHMLPADQRAVAEQLAASLGIGEETAKAAGASAGTHPPHAANLLEISRGARTKRRA